MKSTSPAARLPLRRGSVEYVVGSEADHEAVYQTLLHVFHAPDRETFLGALSDPNYKPEHRLLAKIDGKVVSHIHLTERLIRYSALQLALNGITWVGTLPEYRGLGYAQNLMRLADERAVATGVALQTATTDMPRFYKALGWGVCGRHSVGIAASRNLPATGDGPAEPRPSGGGWNVRPWRQVELGDLMRLYEQQYATTTGSLIRTEDYWRWLIGRRYAHVIWVACQGENVRGYAFVKDHRILEMATDPTHPQAMRVLLARVRAEALERAYPDVIVHAPADHPVLDEFRKGAGRVVDAEEHEGEVSVYHIPDPGRFLTSILPELTRRARASGHGLPLELGLTVGEQRFMIHIESRKARVEPDKLSRRHLNLTSAAFVRLVMGHSGIDRALADDGVESSTSTAVDAARAIFPIQPIWRSPLDAATA